MQEKTRRAAGALGKAVLYGGAAALGLAILTFLFAFLTGGFDARLGLDWARRVLYVIGGVCVVVSGAGLFFAGDAPRDQRIGFKKDETLSAFESFSTSSWWPWRRADRRFGFASQASPGGQHHITAGQTLGLFSRPSKTKHRRTQNVQGRRHARATPVRLMLSRRSA